MEGREARKKTQQQLPTSYTKQESFIHSIITFISLEVFVVYKRWPDSFQVPYSANGNANADTVFGMCQEYAAAAAAATGNWIKLMLKHSKQRSSLNKFHTCSFNAFEQSIRRLFANKNE